MNPLQSFEIYYQLQLILGSTANKEQYINLLSEIDFNEYILTNIFEDLLLFIKIRPESRDAIIEIKSTVLKLAKKLNLDQYIIPIFSNDKYLNGNKYDLSPQIKLIEQDKLEEFITITANPGFSFSELFFYSPIKSKVTYIDVAALNGSVKIFRYLLLNDSPLVNVFKYAIKGGNLEIVRLCSQSPLVNNDVSENLKAAIKYHRYEIFKWLDPNAECNLYSEIFSYRNYDALFYLYEKNKSKIENFFNDPKLQIHFSEAILREFFHLFHIEALQNSFLLSITAKAPAEIQFLLSKGINPNFVDFENESPIFWAVNSGCEMIFKMLLDAGADPYAVNLIYETADITALHHMKSALEIALMYKKYRIQLNRNFLNVVAKTGISEEDFEEVVKLCIDQVNQIDSDGYTPLLSAAESRQMSNVNVLLNQPEVNKDAKNFFGKSYKDILGQI